MVTNTADWSSGLYRQRRLQSVQNAAARLIFRLRRSDHITDALVSLHMVRVPERITPQGCHPDVYIRALTGDVRQYLRQFVCVADVPSRHRLRGPLFPTT